jgi:general secretion pathway protein C
LRLKEKPVLQFALTTICAFAFAAQGPAKELHMKFKRTEVEQQISDLPGVLNQARLEPNGAKGTKGKAAGYRFEHIDAGSIYQKLGFKDGDVLKTVNGTVVDSSATAMLLFSALAREKHFVVTGERGGHAISFVYDIVD